MDIFHSKFLGMVLLNVFAVSICNFNYTFFEHSSQLDKVTHVCFWFPLLQVTVITLFYIWSRFHYALEWVQPKDLLQGSVLVSLSVSVSFSFEPLSLIFVLLSRACVSYNHTVWNGVIAAELLWICFILLQRMTKKSWCSNIQNQTNQMKSFRVANASL